MVQGGAGGAGGGGAAQGRHAGAERQDGQVAGLRAEQRAVEDELEAAEYIYRYAIALLQHCIHGAEYCVHSRKCHSCLLFTLLS